MACTASSWLAACDMFHLPCPISVCKVCKPIQASKLGMLVGSRVPGSRKNYPIPGSSLPEIIPELRAKRTTWYARFICNTNRRQWHCRRHCTLLRARCPACCKHRARQWHRVECQQCTGLRIHPAPCHLAMDVEARNNACTVGGGSLM